MNTRFRSAAVLLVLFSLILILGFLGPAPSDLNAGEPASRPQHRGAQSTPSLAPHSRLHDAPSRAESASPARIHLRDPEPVDPQRRAFLDGLSPRQPQPKSVPRLPNRGHDHRIVVKFLDHLRARPQEDGALSLLADTVPAELSDLAGKHSLSFEPFLRGLEDTMAALEDRSARASGKAQADFRGIASVKPAHAEDILTIATALNDLDVVEYAYIEARDVLPPLPVDLNPPTGDLTPQQTWRGSDPGLDTDYAWSFFGRGRNVRISVLEGAYHPEHEDLVDAKLTNRLAQDFPKLPTAFNDGVDVVEENGITPRNHGTSTLGIICAQDNGYGVTGMAPEATVDFYSERAVNPFFSRAVIITQAMNNSQAGDIMLLEMQTDYGQAEDVFGPAELEPAIWDLTRTAVDAGIVVVAAAGNGNLDLDAVTDYVDRGNSGAIIVGAGSPSVAHTKMSTSSYGSRVDVQAWGSNVTTTGEGDLTVNNDPLQSYWSSYSGTSSASALVAAACTSLQSVSRAIDGVRLTPREMRTLLKSGGHLQGNAQFDGNVGRAVDLQAAIEHNWSVTPKAVVDGFRWTETFHSTSLPAGRSTRTDWHLRRRKRPQCLQRHQPTGNLDPLCPRPVARPRRRPSGRVGTAPHRRVHGRGCQARHPRNHEER